MKTFRIPVLGAVLSVRGKDESVLTFQPELKGKLFRADNSPRVIPMSGALIPRELDLGVLSKKVVTNAGVSYLATDWFDGSLDITNFNAHAHGTGSTAENVTDTALGTEVGTRVAGTKSKPAANQLRTVATLTVGSTFALTEQGIFDSTTSGGSTLWDRSVFSAINVNNGDSVQYTYTVTISAGG